MGDNLKEKVFKEHSVEDDTCGICFTGIHVIDNPRGRINSCNHIFCAFCIKEWGQSTNVCPHCKARFTRIFSVDEAGNEVVTKVRRRNYKLWEEEEEEGNGVETQDDDDGGDHNNNDGSESGSPVSALTNLVVCEVCGKGDNMIRMILCDRRQCQYTVHLDCINISERPIEFFCPHCTRFRAPVSSPPILTETAQNESKRNDGVQGDVVPISLKPTVSVSDPTVDFRISVAATSPAQVYAGKKVLMPPPALLRHALGRGAERTQVLQQPSQAVKPAPPTVLHSTPFLSEEREGSNNGLVSVGSEDDVIHRAAQAAMQQYLQRRKERGDYACIRQKRQVNIPRCNNVLPNNVTHSRKRLRSGTESSEKGEENEFLLLDPATQRREEDRLARRFVLEILPTLRRNQFICDNQLHLGDSGEIVASPNPTEDEIAHREEKIYMQAMREARRMARERVEASVSRARMKKERHILVQAQREAAALAKLARIIASHRPSPKLTR